MDYTTTKPLQLKVLIAGAGIGGLTAAIALRRQGHDVELLESTKEPNEVGAAIHICYNADSVLKHLGVDVGESGGVRMERIQLLKASGEMLKDNNFLENAHRWQGIYRLTLRGALHGHLRSVATASDGQGPPAQIYYSRKITNVDAQAGSVTFADGTSKQGDLIIGADGVHSIARKQIDPHIEAKPGHHSAFRFLVSEKEVLEDPRCASFFSTRNHQMLWYAKDRKVVMYRCENNDLLNFVCIHPGHMSSAVHDSYNAVADKSLVLDIFHDFEPGLLAIFEKANPKSLRVYPLFDMGPLPTFVKGKMALLGDAAHPFLPHLAQGGAMAIEDGVSLGVMMSELTSLDDIPARLKLYNEARYERDMTIQRYTRIVGGDGVKDEQKSGEELSLHKYMEYPYSHDEQHASTAILRRHLWSQKPNLYWRQPVAFGPMPGPRQDWYGNPQKDWDKVRCTTARIVLKTSATLLRNLFPNNQYSFKSKDTVATASIRLQMPTNLAWLGGGGYNLVGFYIHNVTYTAANGKEYDATYLPAMFENLADPIMTGREELGFPKVFSNINVKQDDGALKASLSWCGATWAEFVWPLAHQNGDTAAEPIARRTETERLLLHRAMPTVGDQSKMAPSQYAAYYPSQTIDTKLHREQICPTPAKLSFTPHDWRKLPTLHHIVSRLEELPVFSITESTVAEEEGWTDFHEFAKIEV